MTWLDHINHVSANISKRCGVLNRVKYNLPNCTLKMLAEAMIIPNFDYCSPVWSNCNNELKTRLQNIRTNWLELFYLLILGLQLIT